MVSTCPNCKRQIEHEDFLFEVQCECGLRFNPFYDGNNVSTGHGEDPGTGGGTTNVGDTPSAGEGYSESRAAFAEIVHFGENNEDPAPNPEPELGLGNDEIAVAPPPVARRAPSAPTADLSSSGNGDTLMTCAESIESYSITQYFGPLSAYVTLDESANPLAPAFHQIWQQCINYGGNAVISLRWAISPDGTKCLVTGVPVRCAPKS